MRATPILLLLYSVFRLKKKKKKIGYYRVGVNGRVIYGRDDYENRWIIRRVKKSK